MNPPVAVIEAAFRTLLDSLYAAPASDLGYRRWGVKTVRHGIDVAAFLRRLYPDAKFVFLIRHPLLCLLSIKRRNWIDYEGRDPLGYYARHWHKLARDFRRADFGHLVYFRDLVSKPEVLKSLETHLEFTGIPPDFVAHSHVDWKAKRKAGLTWRERLRVWWLLRSEMVHHGYGMDGVWRLGLPGIQRMAGWVQAAKTCSGAACT